MFLQYFKAIIIFTLIRDSDIFHKMFQRPISYLIFMHVHINYNNDINHDDNKIQQKDSFEKY